MDIKNPNQLQCVHNKGQILKLFDDKLEALQYLRSIKQNITDAEREPLYKVLLKIRQYGYDDCKYNIKRINELKEMENNND
jgi:hypothetical protein